ncbi:hypothetical protein AB0F17_34275 [Nonomuraea sp. NPDC026600]|uniref:hypothetical protein n=1 Tax=Nonomuraea sp. NPDC026600 TaxID=3155363 RepID=UPI0033E86600
MSDTVTVMTAYLRNEVGEKRSQLPGMRLLAEHAAAVGERRADHAAAAARLADASSGTISPGEADALILWMLARPSVTDGFHSRPTLGLLTRVCNIPAPATT